MTWNDVGFPGDGSDVPEDLYASLDDPRNDDPCADCGHRRGMHRSVMFTDGPPRCHVGECECVAFKEED